MDPKLSLTRDIFESQRNITVENIRKHKEILKARRRKMSKTPEKEDLLLQIQLRE